MKATQLRQRCTLESLRQAEGFIREEANMAMESGVEAKDVPAMRACAKWLREEILRRRKKGQR